MTGVLPEEATCIIEPTVNITAPKPRAIRRPNLSPMGAAAKEPKKHPACNSETMLAEKASRTDVDAPSNPKSLEQVRGEQKSWNAGLTSGKETIRLMFQ